MNLFFPRETLRYPRILLLNGPNLNMLGKTQQDPHYGAFTLADAEDATRSEAARYGYALDAFQSNHEGALVSAFHMAMGVYEGVVINAGAFTPLQLRAARCH